MTKLTLSDIRKLTPCYDPGLYLPENWKGTVEDLLLTEEAPANDRIWIALRFVPRDVAVVFAIDCAFTVTDVVDADYADFDAGNYAAVAYVAAGYAAYAAGCAAAKADYAITDADAQDLSAYATYAATSAADVAEVANAERERQIDALLWLIKDEVRSE